MQLARRIEPALALIQGAVTGRDRFDPATARHTFTLGMSDDLETALLPPAAGRHGRAARHPDSPSGRPTATPSPSCSTAARSTSASPPAPAHGPDHRTEDLFSSGYTCLFSPRLLPLPTPLGLDDYLAHPHPPRSPTTAAAASWTTLLDARGLTRRVIASTTHFAGAALHLTTLPALATSPIHAATVYAGTLGLTATEPPLPMPRYTVSAIWHATVTDDPAHTWLRHLVSRTEPPPRPRSPAPDPAIRTGTTDRCAQTTRPKSMGVGA